MAHHSGARFVADVRGLSDELRRYRFQEDGVSDALAYADQTIGPDGIQVSLPQRIAEVLDRHGPYSPNVRARVEQRLTGPTGRDS